MTDLSLLKDGPIQVKGDFSIKDSEGNDVDCKNVVFLCRCGASSNKPFCDGAHKGAGFSG